MKTTNYNTEQDTKNILPSLQPFNKNLFISSISIINDMGIEYCSKARIVKDTKENPLKKHRQFYYFLTQPEFIKISTKVEYVLRNHVSKQELKKIHSDIEVAIEYCLLFLTNFNKTYIYTSGIQETKNKRLKQGWINLKAEYLQDFFSNDPLTYKKIIELLLKGSTKKGAIIECDYEAITGVKSYSYRLTDTYRDKGFVTYQVKTKEVTKIVTKQYYSKLAEIENNPICKNLFNLYANITLPTEKELIEEAKRLKKLKYINKKGKKLTFLGNNSRDKFKGNYSFVEDHLEMFKYLTEGGFMLPHIGDEKSGGRVVDSFSLMPSWMRRLVKINDNSTIEVDCVALHPNIAAKIYNGTSEFITHQKVAESLNIDIQVVKIEHLSFFNKRVEDMKKSILWEYYIKNDPEMLSNIIKDKNTNGYKMTSKRLFKAEVDIMSEVVKSLSSEEIYVGYVYDALFCETKNKQRVTEVINNFILSQNLKTIAK